MYIDVAKMEENVLSGRHDFLVAVKSFDIEAIRRRHMANPKGSFTRRPPAVGGLCHLVVRGGVPDFKMLAEVRECRGVSVEDGFLAVSAEDEVIVVGHDSLKVFRNPWFSYIHTVRLAEGRRVLVASAGWDRVIELSTSDGKVLGEWIAWEHGCSGGKDSLGWPTRLTRDPEVAERCWNRGERARLCADPKDILPTGCRATSISSAEYDGETWVLTLFRQGEVISVRQDGHSKMLMEGLASPHNGQVKDGVVWAADTGRGRVLGLGARPYEFDFSSLPGNLHAPVEWLQSFCWCEDGSLAAVDSNRNAIWLVGMTMRQRVPIPEGWAVQEIVPCPPGAMPLVERVKEVFQ